MANRWSRTQKLTALGIAMSSMLSIASILVSLGTEHKIVNVITNVTKHEKEIANIREAIHQQYSMLRTEQFTKEDLGKRMAIFRDVSESSHYVFFVLKEAPEINSVVIMNSVGMTAPSSTYKVTQYPNIVKLKIGSPLDQGSMEEHYSVKYLPGLSAGKLGTIANIPSE